MNCKVYELNIKVYLLKDINSNISHNSISEIIDKTLSKDEKYLKLHNENTFKNYCFNNFYPIENDYTFKKGNIYSFKMRTIDLEFANFITKQMINEYTSSMKVLGISINTIPIKHIDRIFNITPMIFKFEDGYWRKNKTFAEIEDRIKCNLIKKYNAYYGTNISTDTDIFMECKLKNKKPLPSKYKEIVLLGDKMEFKVLNDSLSQELIYFSLGTGLAEMNTRGFGFINYVWTPKSN